MGWANDFYAYLETDPLFRKYEHKALNFPLMYAFSERYVMPVSHDEVVHGKKSLVNKPFGEYEDKFRQMRAALLLMYTYPGKKMLFMGCEFAQFREWNYDDSLEWFMLEYKNHSAMRDYVSALNTFYLSSPELFEIDFDPEGFFWLLPDENEKNLVAFKRRRRSGEEISVIINFSGSEQRISTDIFNANKLKNIFSTSPGLFDNEYVLRARGKTVTLDLCIPAFSGVAFKEIKNKKIKLKGEPHHVL
jgi:1,4-alpha-glucan branching enzyme